MALTKIQLERLQELIKKRFLSFTYEALGPSALTGDEIALLKKAGLIRESVRHLSGDAYVLGKIVALVEREKARALSFEDAMRAAKRMVPMTEVEKKAIEFASMKAGQHIKGIMDDAVKEAGTYGSVAAGDAMRAVRAGVSEAIANRETKSELKTRLFDSIENRHRDWLRVAHTEINDAIQHGIYDEIREKSDDGADQLVYRRPAPDACRYCKALYLEADGITPKIFKLKHLQPTNVGRKARDWKPVIGSTHPWCGCQTHVVVDGFNFKKVRVVKEEFVADGVERSPGEILEEAEWKRLSSANKKKTGFATTLSYTGEKARASVLKSSPHSENAGDQCLCEF